MSSNDLQRVDRGLTVQGGFTGMVSLPPVWVKKMKLVERKKNLEESGQKKPVLLTVFMFSRDNDFLSIVPIEYPKKTVQQDTVVILVSNEEIDEIEKIEKTLRKENIDEGLSFESRKWSSQLNRKQRELLRNLNRKTDMILRKIVAAYLVGYDYIDVRPRDRALVPSSKIDLPLALRNKIRRFVSDKLRDVDGFLAEELPERVEIQVQMPTGKEKTIKEALQLMCTRTKLLHSGAISLLTSLDKISSEFLKREIEASFKNLEEHENSVDEHFLYIVRTAKQAARSPRFLVAQGLGNYRELMGYRVMAKPIERIADHSFKIALTLSDLAQKGIRFREKAAGEERGFEEQVKKLSADILSVFERMTKAFTNKRLDFADANRQIDDAIKVIADEEEYFKELGKLESTIGLNSEPPEISAERIWAERVILESMRRIADYTITVGQVILNLCVDSRIQPRKILSGGLQIEHPNVLE